MDNKNSKTSSNIDGVDDAEKASNFSKNTIMHRPDNVESVQNVRLIWLDKNIDEENSTDYRNIITQLRRTVNTLNMFTDANQCIDFLTNIDDEQVFLIISGALYQKLIPLIHDIAQLHTIYIFCGNKTRHGLRAKEWPKVKGVFTEISPICDALKQSAQQCEQNAIPLNFVTISSGVFADYHHTLNIIINFEQTYYDQTPIWWYTGEYFLYPMLNHTLPTMNINIIIKMNFFINDLHRHTEQLYSDQFSGHHSSETFTVYREQGMSKIDFEQMVKTKDGLISFNNFLSISKDHDVSFAFAKSDQDNPDLVGILFVMTTEPSKSTTPFASIADVGYYRDAEDEVLFSMHTVFCTHDSLPIDENHQLFQANLILTSDHGKDLCVLTDGMREETFPDNEGWYRMGESDKTQQFYEITLEQRINDNEKASLHGQLRLIKHNPHEHNEIIRFYEKLLDIRQKSLLDCPNKTIYYNNIGAMYANMRKYSRAPSYFEKALKISWQSSPRDHPDLATSYNNNIEIMCD